MTKPTIHGNNPKFSASNVLQAAGQAIGEIRQQDGLTWDDVGAVLGKSADQAAKYADGTAEMGLVAYSRAKREWNGRFTGYVDRLCEQGRPGRMRDRSTVTTLLEAVTVINAALEDDDLVSADEVFHARPQLEAARDALEHHLAKLSLRPVGGGNG